MKKSSSRDETSFTSVAGPSYYNEYLQYGVSHCDDFFYIFKVKRSIFQHDVNPSPQFDLDYSNWSEVNWFTSRAMSSIWGNFAKMGDPTPPGRSWYATPLEPALF